ncbi:MAG: c-type cytochrome [Desulfuromonadales bacterium]
MKRSRCFAPLATALAATALLVVPPAIAADTGGPGRVMTRTKCKGCHVEGATAGTVTPLSKTQRQWERFFEKGQHEKKAPGAFKQMAPKELEQIRQYLIDHAADSPQPETCG